MVDIFFNFKQFESELENKFKENIYNHFSEKLNCSCRQKDININMFSNTDNGDKYLVYCENCNKQKIVKTDILDIDILDQYLE